MTDVATLVGHLRPYRDIGDPLLVSALDEARASGDQRRQLRASLALLPVDASQSKYLYEELLQAEPEQFPVIRDFLADHKDQFVQQLWQLLENPQGDADEQLHAAAALATYDPENPKWETARKRAAAELVAVNPAFLGPWKEALRPKAKELIQPLSEIYRNDTQDELARSLATSLLADYASQDARQLANLVSTATAKQFAVLYPVLSKLDSVAVKELQSILQQKTEPTWNDADLDPAWQPVPMAIKQEIESAGGIVDERFAFCQTMPLQQCAEIIESLRNSGYRPARFRPCAVDDGAVQVAAVWTRDSRTWQIGHDLTAEQIQGKDQELRQNGLIPVDVFGYLGRDQEGQPASRYAAIWIESGEEDQDPEVRMYAGVPVGSEQAEHAQPRSAVGFNRLTLHAFVGPDGVEHRSSIWSKEKGQEESTSQVFVGSETHFTGEIYPGLLLSDLHVSRAAKPQDPQEQYAAQLKSLETLLADRADDANLRKAIATVRFQMKQDEQALADLNWLIEKPPNDPQLSMYRAIYRGRERTTFRGNDVGFRVARTYP